MGLDIRLRDIRLNITAVVRTARHASTTSRLIAGRRLRYVVQLLYSPSLLPRPRSPSYSTQQKEAFHPARDPCAAVRINNKKKQLSILLETLVLLHCAHQAAPKFNKIRPAGSIHLNTERETVELPYVVPGSSSSTVKTENSRWKVTTNNVSNMLNGLEKFDGAKPAYFREWPENAAIVLSIIRPDIALVLEGLPKPTAGTLDDGVAADDQISLGT